MAVELNISVRDLVAFVLSAGDLTSVFTGPSRAAEAIRAHQRIQAARPPEYQAELPVQHTVAADGLILQIRGRMDGFWPRNGGVTVEEIKTTRRDLSGVMDAENPVHWGQAKVYAYIIAREQELTEIEVQLTYVRLTNREARSASKSFTFAQLEQFFHELTAAYMGWARKLTAARRLRDETIAALPFPFPEYRAGQREMAVAAYRTIRDGGQLMVQAATGIGKTMAVLFPAFKAMGEGHAAKIFFLAARTTGKMVAEQTLEILRAKGLTVKSLTLTAKDKICFEPEAACTAEECPYAKGHFDRLGEARSALFAHDHWNRDAIAGVAKDHRVCPFELSLDGAWWADVVIGDYNYAFDPRVNLKRFFAEPGEDYTFLVDEAHNLVDRAREMFSAALDKGTILGVRRAVGQKTLPKVYRRLSAINNWFLSARKACVNADRGTQTPSGTDTICTSDDPPDDLEPALRQFLKTAEKWLEKNRPTPFRTVLMELYFEVHNFLRVLEQFGSDYAAISTVAGRDLHLKLACIDPARQMGEVWERCRSAILFSATLAPADYFQTVLGLSPEMDRLRLPSPFPIQYFQPLGMDSISTYYKDRRRTVGAVARSIAALVKAKKGNYLVFCPSYAYLQMIHDAFDEVAGEIPTIVQTREMDEGTREDFVGRFQADNCRTLVGFAVMGGVFGEGIDLKGDRLSGAVVVGVGLPGISPERDLIRDYYDGEYGAGFAYAYQYPGINRVLQAAGRVIRTAADRGVVLLVDRRYAKAEYRTLLPPEWRLQRTPTPEAVQRSVAAFWHTAAEEHDES